ncbi:MAG TPA: GMC family oxidoreductase [Gemmatimonadaceae bacterium]|nr:GMC family oxidoreductase [Gemmatimonadaceae bacterium]
MAAVAADDRPYDVVVIGSGFGGAMAAHVLVNAGMRVLMLERGDWVPRGPANWEPEGVMEETPHYCTETPYRVAAGGERRNELIGSYTCVGGPSVFYGGVALRLREEDFGVRPEIVGDSGARWPIDYAELEPWYTRAERLLAVAGDAERDPTEPWRSAPYAHPADVLSPTSRRIADAARALGLTPFSLPLAINYGNGGGGRRACVRCLTCDCFACAIGAKNDLATTVLPPLIDAGLTLRTNAVVTALEVERARVTAVHGVDRGTNVPFRVRAARVVLAAGALATPHLLLASELERANPAGEHVGHYLIRHVNALTYGVFPHGPDGGEGQRFHKQVGIHDFYGGHPSVRDPRGVLGALQQVHPPPVRLVEKRVPRPVARLLAHGIARATGLLAIAEDQPLASNRVEVDRSVRDRFGLPQLIITHRYTRRDLAARRALVRQARRILRRAGALFTIAHPIRTFSHAAGTVRMGDDSASAPLDRWSRYRGVENLIITDASAMATSGAVNPSLTISALALRAATRIVEEG